MGRDAGSAPARRGGRRRRRRQRPPQGGADAAPGHRPRGRVVRRRPNATSERCREREHRARETSPTARGAPTAVEAGPISADGSHEPGIRREAGRDHASRWRACPTTHRPPPRPGRARSQGCAGDRFGCASAVARAEQQLDAELEEEREADRLHHELQEEQELDHAPAGASRPGSGRTGTPTP